MPYKYLIFVFIFFFYSKSFSQQKRYTYEKGMMGSPFKLVFYASEDSLANVVADSVYKRIQQLNDSLSDYRDGSEINKLSARAGSGEWVSVGEDLFNILAISKEISIKTDGAYDVTLGPVVQLWRRAVRQRTFPEKKEIRSAMRRSGYKKMKLNAANRSVLLKQKGMRLDIGGLGKGFAAEEAIKVVRNFGIQAAMMDAGGKIVVADAPPGTQGWQITISNGSDSLKTMWLANTSVATSGPTYRYFEFNGVRYSHIVNPATGVGLTMHVRTTAIHPNGTMSDALATAFSVSGIARSKKYLKRFPGSKVWLVEISEGKTESWNTID